MYSIFSLLPFLNTGIIPTVVSILLYVGLSLGIFSLAKKCGLKKPALAWVPFLRFYVLGSLTDDYLSKSKGKSTKYRMILPVVVTVAEVAYQLASFATNAALILYLFGIIGGYFLAVLGVASEIMVFATLAYIVIMISILTFVSLISVLSAVISATALVYHGILVWVLHPLYKMCDRENATLYTVLSILFNFAPAIALPYAAGKLEPETQEVFDAYLETETAEA
jgi:hypothetical protein